MDLILGPFADAEIAGMTEDELDFYEDLMNAPDLDLFDWITGQREVPPGYDTAVFRRIVAMWRGEG